MITFLTVSCSEMELRNEELSAKLKQDQDNVDAQFEIQELNGKCADFVSEKEKIERQLSETENIVKEKEYVINDCNIYIENLTEQINERTEEVLSLTEKLQNISSIESKDEEIANLQAELAVLNDNNEKLEALQADLVESQKKVELLEKENEEKDVAMINLDDELSNVKQLYNAVNANMAEYNQQISNLQADLANRNKEIIEFVKIMKNIKASLHSRGSPLSEFIEVKEDSNELSWDHGYEEILEPTKNFIEKLVDDNLEKSKQLDVDKSAHIKYLDDRVEELENVLEEKENLIEKEQSVMQSYLNSYTAEIQMLRQEVSTSQQDKKMTEEKLNKAMAAIQGFVTENLKLSQAAAEKEAELGNERQRLTKESDLLVLENERLKAELAESSENCLESAAKTFYMQKGLNKASREFSKSLEDYRAKFDTVLVAWRTGLESCHLLRARLEELATFMQNILDGEGEAEDLNFSCLSIDMRDLLQKSIDESRLLSASILAGQTSVLEEMSIIGLELHTEDLEGLGEETWTVPSVDVSVFEGADGTPEETVPKSEYDCLLLELRDNLKKRRLAEEELEKVKSNLDRTSESRDSAAKSRIPVADGSVKSRARSGSRRRKTLTKIPGPTAVSDDGDWSEPDKEESRRRIGLDEETDDLGVTGARAGGRSSDEQPVQDAETGVEIRRERGRVERLRSDLAASQRNETELIKQLKQVQSEFGACSKSLEKCKKELKKKQELASKIEGKSQQIDGENDQQRLIIRNLETEKTGIERRLASANEMIEKLNKAVDWWKSECRRFQQEFEVVGSVAGEEAEIKYQQLVVKYNNLVKELEQLKQEAKLKSEENESYKEKLELLEVEKELLVDQHELESLKSKYQKKKAEVNKLRGTNVLLEERCAELEEVVRVNDMKLSSKDENLSTAELLLKELNEDNKVLKEDTAQLSVRNTELTTELKQLKESFNNYRQEFSDEIIQNKVNEVETKMKVQGEGMRKLAEELLRVEAERKHLESRLETREDLLKTAEKEIGILKESVSGEKYKTEELGKTLENMRRNISKLEEEKIIKESLEVEFVKIQKQLMLLKEKLRQVESSKKLSDERCASAEKVLKTLTSESFNENKENCETVGGGYNLSKHELETVLQHSRPSSRRQAGSLGLSSLDNMNNVSTSARSSLPAQVTASTCCSHLEELQGVKVERDAALAKLKSTRSHLATAAEKLSLSNKKKKEMEKELCQQLSKTHKVLRKTKANLENFSAAGGGGEL